MEVYQNLMGVEPANINIFEVNVFALQWLGRSGSEGRNSLGTSPRESDSQKSGLETSGK